MSFIYSLWLKFWVYAVAAGGAVVAFLLFVSNIKRGEREKLKAEAKEVVTKFKEEAADERIKRDEDLNTIDDVELAERMSKYTKPDRS